MAAMSSAELIRQIGTALYGTGYQHDLAAALGINRRTVSRWSLGPVEPRPGIWTELLQLVEDRQRELAQLIEAIDERVEGAK